MRIEVDVCEVCRTTYPVTSEPKLTTVAIVVQDRTYFPESVDGARGEVCSVECMCKAAARAWQRAHGQEVPMPATAAPRRG